MENIHENQVGEVSPYQFEPEVGAKTSNLSDESDSEQGSGLSSSDEEIDDEFERANAWRLQTLSWCKCGHCTISTKAIECFCCHEKALEYDEYDVLLDQTETQGEKCLTTHPDFQDSMLSEGVLKIDVCCYYLEENWPLDDGDLERNTQTVSAGGISAMFSLGFPDFGEKEAKTFSCLCLFKNTRTVRIA